jgi:hypothetical protein
MELPSASFGLVRTGPSTLGDSQGTALANISSGTGQGLKEALTRPLLPSPTTTPSSLPAHMQTVTLTLLHAAAQCRCLPMFRLEYSEFQLPPEATRFPLVKD